MPTTLRRFLFILAIALAHSLAAQEKPSPAAKPVEALPHWDLDAALETASNSSGQGAPGQGRDLGVLRRAALAEAATRVFAYYGLPKVAPGTKVPGMVLVHGGGGTAFDAWVRLWNSRGYAAIAMDTCGCVPIGSYGKWQRHAAGGPPGWGGFDQIDEPRRGSMDLPCHRRRGPGPFPLAVPARGRSASGSD